MSYLVTVLIYVTPDVLNATVSHFAGGCAIFCAALIAASLRANLKS
jgi:hypothetical protein